MGGGVFCPLPQPERGPLNTSLKKDRYTLIEQSGSRPFLAPGLSNEPYPQLRKNGEKCGGLCTESHWEETKSSRP